MRPTDEHQHGSTQPSMLSDGRRRYADDDNILARLERDAARQAQGNRSRAAWHAVAAALVLLLVLLVAWMAYDNIKTPHAGPGPRAAIAPVLVPAPVSAPAPVAFPDSVSPASPPVLPPAAAPANEVHKAAPPPLVLLPKHDNVSGKPAGPGDAVAIPPAERVKPVARPGPARVAFQSQRISKAAAGADNAGADTPIDTDVALLSAIIIHDSTHAAEKAQLDAAAACARSGDKRCARRAVAGEGYRDHHE